MSLVNVGARAALDVEVVVGTFRAYVPGIAPGEIVALPGLDSRAGSGGTIDYVDADFHRRVLNLPIGGVAIVDDASATGGGTHPRAGRLRLFLCRLGFRDLG